MFGYNPDFDYLYDRQQDRPVCLCLRCKREIYRHGIAICDICIDKYLEEDYE